MNHISSINFKKSNPIQTRHNDRDLPPNYLIGGNYEINRNHKEALKLKNKIIYKAINAYNNNKTPKAPPFKAKSYEWSAVCNIKPETTMQDLEKLASHFFNKYGFQCYQIAIHRDEGHINEQGEKVINHHAHLEFITLDKQTGKNNYRRELITPKVLREIQTEIAEILQMQRGQDKRLSGRQRIEPRKYAQMKEAEKRERIEIIQELVTQKEIKAILEDFRKQSIGKGYPKEFFKELSDLKQNTKEATLDDLKNILKNLAKAYESKNNEYELLKQELQALKEREKILKENLEKIESEKNALESDLKQKNQKNDKTQGQENKNDLRGNSELLNAINENKLKELSEKELDEKIKKLEEAYTGKAIEKIEIDNLKLEKNRLLGLTPIRKFKQKISDESFSNLVKIRLQWIDRYKKDIESKNKPQESLEKLTTSLNDLAKDNQELFNYCLQTRFKNDFDKWLNKNNFKIKEAEIYRGR